MVDINKEAAAVSNRSSLAVNISLGLHVLISGQSLNLVSYYETGSSVETGLTITKYEQYVYKYGQWKKNNLIPKIK